MGRKARMRKMLREEDLEELLEQAEPEAKEAVAAKAAESEEGAAAKVLELQKTAGNRAVGAALQRWGGPGLAAAAQQQPQWPKEPQLLLDGKPIPLESYSESPNRSSSVGTVGGGTTRPKGEEFSGPGDINAMLKWGDWVADLYQAALEGKHYTTVEIVIPTKDGKGFRMILTDVMLSGYSMGAGLDTPSVQLSFQFKKREFAQTPPPKR